MRKLLLACVFLSSACTGYRRVDHATPATRDPVLPTAVVELRNHQYITVYGARVVRDSVLAYIDEERSTPLAFASADVLVLLEPRFSLTRTAAWGAFVVVVGHRVLSMMFPST